MRGMVMAAALALAACGQQSPGADLRPLGANETRMEGVITNVEDGGYPLFILSLAPADGEATTLTLDDSEADLGAVESPGALAGQSVVLYVSRTMENELLDLRLARRSLLGVADADAARGVAITGILSGADEVSGGDLPDVITVTDATGHAESFDYFITPEMVAVNGEQVTAHFREAERERVTYVRVVE